MLPKTWILISILQLNKGFFPLGISPLALKGENETKRVIMFIRRPGCTHFGFQARAGPQWPLALSPWQSAGHQPLQTHSLPRRLLLVTPVAHVDTPRVHCLLSCHTIISCSGASLMPLSQKLTHVASVQATQKSENACFMKGIRTQGHWESTDTFFSPPLTAWTVWRCSDYR